MTVEELQEQLQLEKQRKNKQNLGPNHYRQRPPQHRQQGRQQPQIAAPIQLQSMVLYML